MNKRKLYYLLHNGKNSNLKYFIKSYLREYTPKKFSKIRLQSLIEQLDKQPDKDYILQRVNYYCKLNADNQYDKIAWENRAVSLRKQPITRQKVYYFDVMEIARYFNQSLHWILDPADKPYVAPEPAIVKNRPLVANNDNSVILKFEKVRHFLFVNDRKAWRDKKNVTIFRGDLGPRKENRDVFMNLFADD